MMRYEEHITRAMLRAEPKALFVFGDNLERRGYGGQAKEMRGEPNAVGIPTKRSPRMDERAFFTDADFDEASRAIDEGFGRLLRGAAARRDIIWPKAGIGTGLAQLERRAPRIWGLIEGYRRILEATCNDQAR